MMRTRDPRVRQTINQISHNLESANETAQEGIYTFSHDYIFPCFTAVGNCIYSCTAPCLPRREEHLRLRRRRYADFDFYDDWDNEESEDTILGWGTDELDRLLAGSGLARGSSEQPRRPRKMSYGTRRTNRRKSGLLAPDERNDPTVIPSSSFLGFLERFPWRFGSRGIKYRPSAADLQEHPTGLRRHAYEESPLMEADEENEGQPSNCKNGRYRSSTQSSRDTETSLSSRGDLIPSDDEEDAVPLDDEFAITLTSRRGTGLSDEQSAAKPESMKSASGTFSQTTNTSSKGSKKKKKKKKKKSSRMRSPPDLYVDILHDVTPVSIADLKKEEEQVELEEESEVIRRRVAARQLALNRGMSLRNNKASSQSLSSRSPDVFTDLAHHDTSLHTSQELGSNYDLPNEPTAVSEQQSNLPRSEDDFRTEPFPPFPLTPSTATESGGPTPTSQPDSIRDASTYLSSLRRADSPTTNQDSRPSHEPTDDET